MSKLPKSHQFIDLSDYGRRPARWIAYKLVPTPITPVGVTFLFVIAGALAIYAILEKQFFLAAILLIIKSVLDAADGELARIRKTPSYTGRYLDSISDLILNAIILGTIGFLTNTPWFLTVLAFIALQLQGTLYNYWYVILRKKFDGEQTSRVFEVETPIAYPGENQTIVTILYYLYRALYGVFDKIIYVLDPKAPDDPPVPSWLMSIVSTSGLGFQLLLIGIFLNMGWVPHIIPFFIAYTFLIPVFIITRKILARMESKRK